MQLTFPKFQATRLAFTNTTGVLQMSKSQVKSPFFTIITILLIIFLISMNLWQGWKATSEQIHIQKNNWIEEISFLLKTQDTKIQSQILDNLEKEITQSVSPITGFLGWQGSAASDLKNVKELTKVWLNAIQPLLEYRLDSSGLNSKIDIRKNFTDDLAVFFDKLPDLIVRTEKVWQEMWEYRLLLANSQSDLADFVSEIPNLLKWMHRILDDKQTILTSLGHFDTQKIIIFNQNIGEARPTGGFFGSFIPIEISKGHLSIGQSQSIYFVDNQSRPMYAHPAIWYYSWFDGVSGLHGFRNANLFPCFPDTAKYLEREFSQSRTGFDSNAIVLVNPQLLLGFLPDGWEAQVPEVGRLNKSNLMEQIERITSIEADDASNPKSKITPILENILSDFSSFNLSPMQILSQIYTSFSARNIQIWLKNQKAEKLLSDLALDGSQTCQNRYPNKQIITPLIANISGDKRNLVTQNQFSLYSEELFASRKITLKYKQILPNNPALQRGFNAQTGLTFVGLQLPANVRNLQVSSPQALHLPFLRPYYTQNLNLNPNQIIDNPPEIKTVIQTGQNLYSTDGSIPGFSYTQPDSSQVLGIYINDETVSEVEFSFEISKDNPILDFYGQPGLQTPTLSLGDGVDFWDFSTMKVINQSETIQAGLSLRLG